jgi:hypothetical protein
MAAIVGVLAMAGCESVPPEAEAAAEKVVPAAVPGSADRTKDDTLAKAEEEQPAPVQPPLPPLSMTAPVDNGEHPVLDTDAVPGPERLIGLDEDGVAALLGQPAFKRRDPPAQVWQYSDRTCILDLFLYREGAGRSYKVAHVAARGRDVVTVSRRDCFLELLKQRRKKDASG